MSKKKSSNANTAKTNKVYVLTNGDRYDITGEDGRYYYCSGKTQFRKSAMRGVVVQEAVEAEVKEEETEG